MKGLVFYFSFLFSDKVPLSNLHLQFLLIPLLFSPPFFNHEGLFFSNPTQSEVHVLLWGRVIRLLLLAYIVNSFLIVLDGCSFGSDDVAILISEGISTSTHVSPHSPHVVSLFQLLSPFSFLLSIVQCPLDFILRQKRISVFLTSSFSLH